MRIIPIKIYLTSGIREIDKEYETYKRIREHHQNLRCLLLVFNLAQKGGKLLGRMQEFREEKAGFDYIALKGCETSLANELTSRLDLGTILK